MLEERRGHAPAGCYFLFSKGGRRRRIDLKGNRLAIGRAPGSQISFPKDLTISRTHAVVELCGEDWTVRDLGSANGTLVNNTRILAAKVLRSRDVVTVGETRLEFINPADTSAILRTEKAVRPPELTTREREVLIALCRPILHGGAFPQPATVKEMADELFVGEAAVKFMLGNLYVKFDIPATGGAPRRVRLASAAIDSGAVTFDDLRPKSSDDEPS